VSGVISVDLARRLVSAQFPALADRPLTAIAQPGSDHVIYRLGDELAVRLPRSDWVAGQAIKEHTWLPWLSPKMPLAIPEPVGLGEPAFGYPYHWSIVRWLDGEPATTALGDDDQAARDLAGFLHALWSLPVPDGPHPELTRRTLADQDEEVRTAIAAVAADFDPAAMTEVWQHALAAPPWPGPPAWCHGDFHAGNLLTRAGRVTAVIDFGGFGRGDPACDLDIAYTLMNPGMRACFRSALGLDDTAWDRGRGWSLAGGVKAHAAYAATEPRIAAQTRRQITAVLHEVASPAQPTIGSV
jgi:aminoglycoside phosphotransferase (APT) family kinase protein